MFNNIKEAIFWIENIKRKEKRTDLSRITKVLNDHNNPQENFTKVHVAGTNGKGSTCHILKTCLQNKYKVGVFTSPYVTVFNERIKINDEYISDNDLLRYINSSYNYFINYEKENGDIIPFFELIFLISLLYFKDNKVDIAIIEVGVGGVLDCTNCFNYEVSAISNIGFDHIDYLGPTIEDIAMHKFGILKENNTLYTTISEDLYKLLKKFCMKKNITKNLINTKDISNIKLDINQTSFTYNGFDFKTTLLGIHQVYNTVLAISILNDYFKFSYFEINKFISNVSFNGRFEILSEKPLIIIDGAHNVDGINSLVQTVKLLFNKKVNFCFAAMKDKDIENMVNKIEDVSKSISFTQINYYRTNDVNNFKSNLSNISYYDKIDNLIDNVKKLDDEEIVIFTGSLYFISEIRKYFK
ncbi:MAG: Mur ligase family protein [bacterium]